MSRKPASIRVLALLIFFVAGLASATTYRQLDLQAVFERTEVAFVGTVASVSVEPRGEVPWTVVEFEVERMLAGSTPQSGLRLEFLGGELAGGQALRVNLMPEFEVGEVVLVLAYDEQYYSPIVGFNQGLWRLSDGVFVDERGRRLGLDAQGQLVAGEGESAREDIIDAVAEALEGLE